MMLLRNTTAVVLDWVYDLGSLARARRGKSGAETRAVVLLTLGFKTSESGTSGIVAWGGGGGRKSCGFSQTRELKRNVK